MRQTRNIILIKIKLNMENKCEESRDINLVSRNIGSENQEYGRAI